MLPGWNLTTVSGSLPLSAAVPVPSFGYPVPPLELPSSLPVSPPPGTHNKNTFVNGKKKHTTMPLYGDTPRERKPATGHSFSPTLTHRIIHKYIFEYSSHVFPVQKYINKWGRMKIKSGSFCSQKFFFLRRMEANLYLQLLAEPRDTNCFLIESVQIYIFNNKHLRQHQNDETTPDFALTGK